jgi:Na+-driven multidrug efflux pump
VGYNYGAGLYGRVRSVVRWGALGATIFFLGTFALVMTFTRELARLFTSDPELLALCVKGLRLGYLGIPFVGLGIIAGFTFQGLGRGRESLFLTACRHVLFIVIPLTFMPRMLGLNGVFLTFPISDCLGGLLGGAMLWREMVRLRRKESPLPEDRLPRDGADGPAEVPGGD